MKQPSIIGRRDFIKQSCLLCASIAGLGTVVTQFSACAPMPVFKADVKDGQLTVLKNSFTEKNKIVLVRNTKLEWDIALVKVSEMEYAALQMKCTHLDNPLTATQNGFYCNSHGSSFNLSGKVTQEPAINDLKKYATTISNEEIIIQL
jgi:Rieske Fe-S protein